MANLLYVVQEVMSSLDSDEINSVSDNPESLSVAKIVEAVYRHITSQIEFLRQHNVFEVEGNNDPLLPCVMHIPENVRDIDFLKYDHRTVTDDDVSYQDVCPLPVKDFLDRMYLLDEDDPSVGMGNLTLEDGGSFTMKWWKNRGPKFYTRLDDRTLIFDSYDNQMDTSLHKNKTIAYGWLDPKAFVLQDTFVIDLDNKNLDILINESKSLAWAELKQSQNANTGKMARRGWTKSQPTELKRPWYGRNR